MSSLPLEFLWKWLFVHFDPATSVDEVIASDQLIDEFFNDPELMSDNNNNSNSNSNKGNLDNRTKMMCKAIMPRWLCLLYKESPLVSEKFMDKTREFFYLKRTSPEDQQLRLVSYPPAPELKSKLRAELVNEASARNLRDLMGEKQITGIKRSADDSNLEDGAAIKKQKLLNHRANPQLVKYPSVPANINSRTSVNSSALYQQQQQQPWKREVSELFAKQLAMMRDIHSLKTELARREQVRQNEILFMRQELDMMRTEFYRQRQGQGIQRKEQQQSQQAQSQQQQAAQQQQQQQQQQQSQQAQPQSPTNSQQEQKKASDE